MLRADGFQRRLAKANMSSRIRQMATFGLAVEKNFEHLAYRYDYERAVQDGMPCGRTR